MASIWQIAKTMETEGRKMYEVFAKGAPNRELAGVFSALANDEQNHYNTFDALERSVKLEPVADVSGTVNVAMIFDSIRNAFKVDDKALAALHDAGASYENALVAEQKSIDLYNEILAGQKDESLKVAITFIINEEKRHIKIIEGLIDLVRRPKEWLEDAEIHHQDKY
jgi:rubrerythrin